MATNQTQDGASGEQAVFVGAIFPADRAKLDTAWQSIEPETAEAGAANAIDEAVAREADPNISTWREANGLRTEGFYFPSGFKDYWRHSAERK